MVDTSKRPKLVGNFIRQRRESLGLSQRALGLMFNPTVTTQFISNVERGVTPLPPSHIPILTKALNVEESEIMNLLAQEYSAKLTGRLGKGNGASVPVENGNGNGSAPALAVAKDDYDFLRVIYEAYSNADGKTRQAFMSACETVLNIKPPTSS